MSGIFQLQLLMNLANSATSQPCPTTNAFAAKKSCNDISDKQDISDLARRFRKGRNWCIALPVLRLASRIKIFSQKPLRMENLATLCCDDYDGVQGWRTVLVPYTFPFIVLVLFSK